jgi:iron complex outermembrane receptor protein
MRLFNAVYRITNSLFISCTELLFRFVPRCRLILTLVAFETVLCGTVASGEDAPADKSKDIYSMPLEALLQMEVTTSARHPEKLSESPAAISVITQEDIHRSGATTIAEALRLAPGLEVARMDSSDWAISARGFNDVFANKLLVLQDGRTIYTPLFSGVFWDVQGTMLEDIDRIEVIRGPGATLWGANAVNGVISIISRSARDTQGTLLSFGGGSEDRGFAAARYGGKISDNAWFRVYANYYNHDDQLLPNGDSADDAWQIGRTGFRVDWDLKPDQDLLTMQGDLYRGEIGHIFGTFDPTSPTLSGTVHDKATVDGGNILGRWSHLFSADSDLSLQMYYDRTERNTAIFKEQRDTFDLDFQHRFGLWNWNSIIWGAGYRFTADRVGNDPTISLFPDKRALNLYSSFVQDEIKLVPDVLGLTLGSKFEHNDFTGFEVQPGARLLWTPHVDHTVWASVSRAVRTPSRAEDDIEINSSAEVAPGVFVPATLHGSRNFVSEELIAYELGYRSQFKERVSLDLASFCNDYCHLRSLEADPLNPTQVTLGNKLYGSSYGIEVATTVKLLNWWRLKGSYTWLEMNLHHRSGSTDTTSADRAEGSNPQNQFLIRSLMDLPHGLALDATLRYVDNLPAIKIDSYLTLDVRLGWRINRHVEVEVGGQNLLQPEHTEFNPSFIQTPRTEIQRAVYGRLTIRF